MALHPPALHIEIRKLGNEFFAVTKQENGKEICTNQFGHDPTGLTHMGPLWLLERGSLGPNEMHALGVNLGGKASESQVAHYGARLYNYLFGKGRQLQKFLKSAESYRQAPIVLSLSADATALWQLPWEYLHDGEQFLCLGSAMPLVRLPASLSELQPAVAPLPLRVLLVIAAPEDQEPLDVEREIAVIQDALHEPLHTGQMHLHILHEGTLPALQAALAEAPYHVIHYTGHGTYSTKQQRGFLCFEDALGNTNPVEAMHLRPLLAQSPTLRLMVLSACQSAQIGVLAAFDTVAAGLLQADVPAVLTIPTSLQDESMIDLCHTLYTQLSEGRLLTQTLNAIRQGLQEIDAEHDVARRRFDWGVPALYSRAQQMRLIDPQLPALAAPPATPSNVRGLPSTPGFVGRRKELQRLRQALHNEVSAIYLWGEDGIGKSALVAQLVAQPGVKLDDILIVRCQDYLQPAAVLGKLANFWRYQGHEPNLAAATLLLDTRRNPTERAQEALQMIGQQRYLIVLDDFDLYLPAESAEMDADGPLIDATLRATLLGLFSARAKTTFLLTGSARWAGLDTIPPEQRVEVPLPYFTQREAVQLMRTLPRLGQLPLATQLRVAQLTSTHPQTLYLLDSWLTCGSDLDALLAAPPVKSQSAQAWSQYLLEAIFDALDPGEYEALTTLAVLRGALDAELVPKLTAVSPKYAKGLLKRWHALALLQFYRTDVDGNVFYTFPPQIRRQLLARLTPQDLELLHARIADYYGAPFREEAQRQILSRSSAPWSPERIEWLARSDGGVLGTWVRQTQDLQRAQQSMNDALAWQHHLFAAGQYEAAGQVVKSILPVLNRWGQRDLSESLLQQSLASQQGEHRLESLRELAKLRLEEGNLEAALQVYEELLTVLAELSARDQMAQTLLQIGGAYRRLGRLDSARQKYEAALQLLREFNDEVGQAACLHQLAGICREQGDHKNALVRSQAARELAHKRGEQPLLARAAYEQGLIFLELQRTAPALESFQQSLALARELRDERLLLQNLEWIGQLLEAQPHPELAAPIYQELAALYRPAAPLKAVAALKKLGELYEKQGRPEDAHQQYLEAHRLLRKAQE